MFIDVYSVQALFATRQPYNPRMSRGVLNRAVTEHPAFEIIAAYSTREATDLTQKHDSPTPDLMTNEAAGDSTRRYC